MNGERRVAPSTDGTRTADPFAAQDTRARERACLCDEQGVAVDARAAWLPSFSNKLVHARYDFCFHDDLEKVADVINSILYDVNRRATSYIFDHLVHLR